MGIFQRYSSVSARLDPQVNWNFETARSSDIARIWTFLKESQPKIFNGPVLMSHSTSGDDRSLQVNLLRTTYAAFMAWRELDHPDRSAKLCFPIAAIRTSDDFYVLGTMASHTSNAGLTYFPSGTLNDDDVLPDGTVALERALAREVEEETGLTPADYAAVDGWTRVENDVRCAFFKEARLKWSRSEVSERIASFLESQTDPELSRIAFIKDPADAAGLNLPAVQREYFAKILAAQEQ
ncbi:NUDIX hydrolase [Burkholderia pseudomallei]|nr:NUDIX hydrolase [Burkholderia pseudomallei]ARL10558.1 NUDIX hydrolase [Burkholderia pseudomallei]ARL47877.1 NUDIX hydrolase [Burkholderia pseudomallei]HEB3535230.1 NUDIX hydrolase [Burkholderia cenocepacia]